MSRCAVILCAGSSNRFGSNKLLAPLLGKPVICHSVEVFRAVCDKVVVVTSHNHLSEIRDLLGDNITYVIGANTRTQSSICGLQEAKTYDYVAIHDGARPYITVNFVEKLFKQAESKGSAVPTVACIDTVIDVNGQVIPREQLRCVQTPQVFDTKKIIKAYQEVKGDFTDDSTVYKAEHGFVNYVEGLGGNRKITYKQDLPAQKVGYGYDIHQLTDGRKLVLGGVEIPFNKGLLGHSDADVVLHAVMDALLSSQSLPDIGHYFPTNDAKYDNADSMLLLKKVYGLVSPLCKVVNLAISVVAERPKLAPYLDAMKNNISQALKITPTCVGISVTTAESIGEIGNGDAIACRCVALTSAT